MGLTKGSPDNEDMRLSPDGLASLRDRRPPRRIISISGIDYAGKSTQIAILQDQLESLGMSPVVLWYRPGYSPMLNAIRLVVRKLRPSSLPTAAHAVQREAAFARPWVRTLWLGLAIADSFATFAIRVRWLSLKGHTVICDRYVDDAILDLDLRFPTLRVTEWRSIRLLRRAAPRPLVSILLVLQWDEMMRRLSRKTEPFPDTLHIRALRFRRYQEMATHVDAGALDATRPIEEVHQIIMQRVRAALTHGS